MDTNTAPHWSAHGACRGEDPELFFPVGTTGPALLQVKKAKDVCRRCPVLAQCKEWTLETKPSAGVSGGLSEQDRRTGCGKATTKVGELGRYLALAEGVGLLIDLAAGASVQAMADARSEQEAVVEHALRILAPYAVPPLRRPTSLERILTHEQSLTTLLRAGRTHKQAAETLGCNAQVVSWAVRVIGLRRAAVEQAKQLMGVA
jgi:WhiB family redox-sensing transcriptional regulator